MSASNEACFEFIRRAYRPVRELGRGGMARVYLAESLTSGLKKLVVLKILNRDLAAEKEIRSAFLREAELAARMNHPNVVQVLEIVEHASSPVIVMEYLDGIPLSEVLSHTDRKLSLPLHLYILVQVLTGLHYFHELTDYDGTPLNPVHRDVSPQNVLVLHDGLVKVLDFGIAKVNAEQEHLTRTGYIKGKIKYMPPEQLFNEPEIDRRADIFAVGVMLWEAVTQRRMWEGVTQSRLLRALAAGEIPRVKDVRPDAPDDLIRIVDRALAHDRDERYPTAREMQCDVERCLLNCAEYVQVRNLADFMLEHFGDLRQSQARMVRMAMRNPSSGLGVLNCETRPRPLSVRPGPVEPGTQDPQISTISATLPDFLPGRLLRSRWSWGIIAVALPLSAGIWLMQRDFRHATAPTTDSAGPVAMVQLEVEALPAGAEIYLDGKRLGRGHYRASQQVSERKSLLEVRAPGYVDESREIVLNRDTRLEFSLRATPALAGMASAPASPSVQPSYGPRHGHVRQPVRASGSTPATGPSNRAPGASTACNPPYTFSADGVKTYKPECF